MKRGRRVEEKGSKRKSILLVPVFVANLLGALLQSERICKKNRASPFTFTQFHSNRICGEIEQRRAFPPSFSPCRRHHFVFSFRRMFTGARVHCASADLFSARRPSIRRVARLFRAATTNAKNAPLPRLDSSPSSAAATVAGNGRISVFSTRLKQAFQAAFFAQQMRGGGKVCRDAVRIIFITCSRIVGGVQFREIRFVNSHKQLKIKIKIDLSLKFLGSC